MQYVTVIGAGLAGSEAAWQVAKRGIGVRLIEMRPDKQTPAHQSGKFAELVCSNSFRANNLENAVGVLKEEMRRLDSLIIKCADSNQVPAGGALAVDREAFAAEVTKKISENPLIEVIYQEAERIPKEGIIICATGPLTSDSLAKELLNLTGEEFFYFYDAAAPLVDAESIDYSKAFWASRYDKGDADYLNCPMDQAEYEKFYDALISAETHPLHEFEKKIYFEGCMPVEVMAKRGPQTLLFGPLKPVGLRNPAALENKRPYAVVQLRRDNAAATLFNIVGFQTNLKWDEQKRVFRMIPGLENANFMRFGVMHRNTFINSPKLLSPTTQLLARPNLLMAGQLSGVEGYVESAASGLLAGINAGRLWRQQPALIAPRESALGSMLYYITHTDADNFQPMNITFGLMPPLPENIRDKKKKKIMTAQRAIDSIEEFICQHGLRN